VRQVSNPPSVLDKARDMSAEATRLRRDSDAEHDATRVSERVGEILPLLQQLALVTGAARRLRDVSGEDRVDLSGLDDGRAALARHAGLPSNQAFTAARSRITGVSARVSRDLAAAWSRWAEQRMAALPLMRIGLLETGDQQAARERRDELQKLAKVPVPTSTDISMFESAATQLAEALDEVGDPPQEVLALLQRIGERPPLTLADLADDEIRLLRQAGVAGQIEVRRRGA
jgi:hypothetical protein